MTEAQSASPSAGRAATEPEWRCVAGFVEGLGPEGFTLGGQRFSPREALDAMLRVQGGSWFDLGLPNAAREALYQLFLAWSREGAWARITQGLRREELREERWCASEDGARVWWSEPERVLEWRRGEGTRVLARVRERSAGGARLRLAEEREELLLECDQWALFLDLRGERKAQKRFQTGGPLWWDATGTHLVGWPGALRVGTRVFEGAGGKGPVEVFGPALLFEAPRLCAQERESYLAKCLSPQDTEASALALAELEAPSLPALVYEEPAAGRGLLGLSRGLGPGGAFALHHREGRRVYWGFAEGARVQLLGSFELRLTERRRAALFPTREDVLVALPSPEGGPVLRCAYGRPGRAWTRYELRSFVPPVRVGDALWWADEEGVKSAPVAGGAAAVRFERPVRTTATLAVAPGSALLFEGTAEYPWNLYAGAEAGPAKKKPAGKKRAK